MKQVVYNALKTPDGTVLHSYHVHDYTTHVDKNGKEYMLDGGTSYVRSSANGDEVYLTLYSDAPHKEIREVLSWGTYGKQGREPILFIKLKDLTRDHIKAILENCNGIAPWRRKTFEDELEYRNEQD